VNRTVDIIMIDTVSLAGSCETDFAGCPLRDPTDPEAAEDQWAWLEQQLEQSKADFLWVGGHYPIFSAGSDGTTAVLVQRLLPLLTKHGAHYIGGHDHMHEHIKHDGVNMFVTGPGKECCYDAVHLKTVPKGAIQFMVSGKDGQGPGVGPKPASMHSGFSTMDFDDVVQVIMHKEDGGNVWTPPPIQPRAAGMILQ
jgi:hypothetical protein